MRSAGPSPEQLVLHAGVVERNGCFHDRATRRSVVYDRRVTSARRRDEIVLAHRLGRVRVEWEQVPRQIVGALLHDPRSRPWRVLARSFRRRHPATAGAVVRDVAAAALLPIAITSVGFLGVAGTVVLLVGEHRLVLLAALLGTLICGGSIIAHESAHLVVMRIAERDGAIGAVEHSWLNVWIVAPTLTGWSRRATALAGPFAGAATAAAAALLGAPRWICVVLGAVHVVNLLPSAPDGRLLFERDTVA